ncbi:MAG: hypothetical protein HN411_03040 [Waddliaceae bacterium]|jgi:hypothetical protein|nr:hypothetical protein [Waddliaceae bacterium]MBT3578612.1 hypothetical protein [Waddliaceae bacterium]MBT4445538.1 hypothetical protein [Waddliaceae bacterium]MBT6928401.1 hypothetical protein [Waddliaceae bacterium]MBT7461625.1 hypothetical protein [Waddliaceae bacterium]
MNALILDPDLLKHPFHSFGQEGGNCSEIRDVYDRTAAVGNIEQVTKVAKIVFRDQEAVVEKTRQQGRPLESKRHSKGQARDGIERNSGVVGAKIKKEGIKSVKDMLVKKVEDKAREIKWLFRVAESEKYKRFLTSVSSITCEVRLLTAAEKDEYVDRKQEEWRKEKIEDLANRVFVQQEEDRLTIRLSKKEIKHTVLKEQKMAEAEQIRQFPEKDRWGKKHSGNPFATLEDDVSDC